MFLSCDHFEPIIYLLPIEITIFGWASIVANISASFFG